MAEPGFYRCKTCHRSWQRMEFKMRPNPPRECPYCKAPHEQQEVDQVAEQRYVDAVYKPFVGALFGDPKPK